MGTHDPRADANAADADLMSPRRMRIEPEFLVSHPAHFIALGFGAGLPAFAPGTFGTLVAWGLHWLLSHWLGLGHIAILGVASGLFVIGIWACDRTARDLGVADHGGIVIDEIAAFLVVLAFTPAAWLWQLVAFGLFRFFDIVKPPPIRWFEREVPGGLGVMVDDVLAAGYTVLVLAILVGVTG